MAAGSGQVVRTALPRVTPRQSPHQSLDRTACRVLPLAFQLTPDLGRTVHLMVELPDTIDLLSSRTSRSGALTRTASAPVVPGRCPVSRSCWRIQRRRDSGVQPILPAMETIAAHCDSYWSLASQVARCTVECRGLISTDTSTGGSFTHRGNIDDQATQDIRRGVQAPGRKDDQGTGPAHQPGLQGSGHWTSARRPSAAGLPNTRPSSSVSAHWKPKYAACVRTMQF